RALLPSGTTSAHAVFETSAEEILRQALPPAPGLFTEKSQAKNPVSSTVALACQPQPYGSDETAFKKRSLKRGGTSRYFGCVKTHHQTLASNGLDGGPRKQSTQGLGKGRPGDFGLFDPAAATEPGSFGFTKTVIG
ncbi:MAG: hypothetical protein SGILL_006747, partial [Bacillariaceae sp.]